MAKIVFKDFYAQWCPPCKMQTPIVEELEKEFKGKVEFMKIDVDKNRAEAEKYEIRSIPTIVIEKDGKVKETFVGLQSKEALKDAIKGLI